MSKRKRATKTPSPAPPTPDAEESTDDAVVKDDMVHVTSDLLSGSPDIFAAKKIETEAEPEEASAPVEPEAPATWDVPEAAAEPLAEPEPPAEPEAPAEPEPPWKPEPAEASATLTSEEPPALAPEPPSTPPPSFVSAVPYPAKPRPSGSGAALGIVLVVVGIFALLVVMSGVDLTQNGWPLFIIIPGLTLLVVGVVSVGAVATIPGGIVTMLGVVLAYSNSTGEWPIWAYAWSLVIPGGIGLGMYLQALRDRDHHALRTGRTLIFISLMIFLIGFVLFESILGISGRDAFGAVGKAALPVLLIIVGVILFVRSWQRSRQT